MKTFWFFLGALALARSAFSATEQDRNSTALLLQGFHWESANGSWYPTLESKVAEIQELGVTHVWFPPPSNSAAREGYLPRELYNLNSAYGSEDQLRSAIAAFNRSGIASVADVVINHRVGNWNWADFSNPSWGCEAVVSNDEWPGHCGGADSGESYGAARDIDHSRSVVQNDIKYFLNERLRGLGFTGWRLDFAKGYAPSYVKLYHDASHPDFCVAEYWDGDRQKLINYVNGTQGSCGVFDFATKNLLNQSLRDDNYSRFRDDQAQAGGGIGWWPQKMVTFVDNHDTGPTTSCGAGQNIWPVPCDKVMLGYAYILTHPGIPTLYYPHVFDWGLKKSILSLVTVRKSAGLHSNAAVSIQRAESGLYAAIITGNQGRVAVKIGSRDWNPGSGWNLVTWGNQYAVWTKFLSLIFCPSPLKPGAMALTMVDPNCVSLKTGRPNISAFGRKRLILENFPAPIIGIRGRRNFSSL